MNSSSSPLLLRPWQGACGFSCSRDVLVNRSPKPETRDNHGSGPVSFRRAPGAARHSRAITHRDAAGAMSASTGRAGDHRAIRAKKTQRGDGRVWEERMIGSKPSDVRVAEPIHRQSLADASPSHGPIRRNPTMMLPTPVDPMRMRLYFGGALETDTAAREHPASEPLAMACRVWGAPGRPAAAPERSELQNGPSLACSAHANERTERNNRGIYDPSDSSPISSPRPTHPGGRGAPQKCVGWLGIYPVKVRSPVAALSAPQWSVADKETAQPSLDFLPCFLDYPRTRFKCYGSSSRSTKHFVCMYEVKLEAT